jgi:hypothetical protein
MRPVVQHNGGASDAVAMLQVRVWGLLEESSPDGEWRHDGRGLFWQNLELNMSKVQ